MIPCDLPPEEPDARPPLPATFEGGCHCGKVRYRVTVRRWLVSECNCSLCEKKGFLHVIVPREDLELVTGEDALTTYQFNTRVARHHFCKVCGVHSFYVPRSHPDGFSVNARCLSLAPLSWFDIQPFNGRNWEAHVATVR